MPAVFALNLSASAPDLMELATLPDLNLLRNANFVPPSIGGQAEAKIDFSMPLVKDLPRDQVQTTAKIKVTECQHQAGHSQCGFVGGLAPRRV